MALGHHRARLALLLALAVSVPLLPAAAEDEHHAAAARAVVDDGINLIVPEGESYNLSGYHGYTGEVIINGTLKVDPWDGVNETSGMLNITAASIFIGPSGGIFADGRGYGGGGGGVCDDHAMVGGYGGRNGLGGNGGSCAPNVMAGAGGGGSNGGLTGAWLIPGKPGNETGGGAGGRGSNMQFTGGAGGIGFGGGGGGGGGEDSAYGGGGGGGGGTGGDNGNWTEGGNGAGPAGGKGTSGGTWDGENGGYLKSNSNGDETVDSSIFMGSGGRGGTTAFAAYGGGGGGGGAGGGAVVLNAEETLVIEGHINTTGAGGGHGGLNMFGAAGNGGGGGGGGVLLQGSNVSVSGTIDTRGRQHDALSEVNGGSIKILYLDQCSIPGNLSAGRIITNRVPLMNGLESPGDGNWTLPKPRFSWHPATDPELGNLTYEFHISRTIQFAQSDIVFNAAGIVNTSRTVPFALAEREYFWRVRASDSYGPGPWSEVWRFRVDGDSPVSRVNALPEYTRALNFTLSWSGTDSLSGVSNYSVFVSDNGADYTSWILETNETSGIFSGKEGHSYAFYSLASDIVGNREAAHLKPDASTTIDSVAPFSYVGSPAPFQKAPDFDVSWSASDFTSGVSYIDIYVSVDDGPFTVWKDNMTLDITSSRYVGAEGHAYSFYSIARDFAGNVQAVPGPEYIRTTKVDGTGPGTVFAPGEPNYGNDPIYVAPNMTLYLNATDNFVGVNKTFYVIDARATKEYSGGFNELQAGSHNITFWSVDEAGNTEAQKTVWFFVDNQAPVTQLLFEGGNAVAGNVQFIGPETRLRLAGRDNGSGLDRTLVDVDGAGWRTYDGPFNLSSAGEHTIRFMSVDNLGQEESARTVKVTVDASAPETTVTADSNLSNRDIHVTFAGKDNGSGLSAVFYRVTKAGEAAAAFKMGNETTVAAMPDHSRDGSYVVEYYGVDRVGNNETVRTLVVTIDTVANLTLDWSPEKKVDRDTATLTGKAEPGATVLVNGKKVAVSPDGSFAARLSLKEGRNKVVVSATDPAGNSVERTSYVTYTKPGMAGGLLLPVLMLVIVLIVAVAAYMLSRRGRARPDVMDAEEE